MHVVHSEDAAIHVVHSEDAAVHVVHSEDTDIPAINDTEHDSSEETNNTDLYDPPDWNNHIINST